MSLTRTASKAARRSSCLALAGLLELLGCGARTNLELDLQANAGAAQQPTGPGAPCAPELCGCNGKACSLECDAGLSACGANCVDLRSDGENCGTCGHDCVGGACKGSHCQPVTLVSGQANPLFVAVDRANLYWTLGSGNVLTQPLSGGITRTLYTGTSAEGIAVDSSYVYFSTYTAGTILRVPLGGGPATVLLSTDQRPIGIAVDHSSLYFTTTDGSVSRIPIGGGAPTPIVAGSPGLTAGLAVNDAFAFYGRRDSLRQVLLSGAAAPRLLVGGKSNVFGVALDATDAYWSDEYGGEVGKVSLANGLVTTLVAGRSLYAGGVAVDATCLYWVAIDIDIEGSIMRLAK